MNEDKVFQKAVNEETESNRFTYLSHENDWDGLVKITFTDENGDEESFTASWQHLFFLATED